MITKLNDFLNEGTFSGFYGIPVRKELDIRRENWKCYPNNYPGLLSLVFTVGFGATNPSNGQDLVSQLKAEYGLDDTETGEMFGKLTTNNTAYEKIVAPKLLEILRTDKRFALNSQYLKSIIEEAISQKYKTHVKDKTLLEFMFINRDKIFTLENLRKMLDIVTKIKKGTIKSEGDAANVLTRLGFTIQEIPEDKKVIYDSKYHIDLVTMSPANFVKNGKGYSLFQVKKTPNVKPGRTEIVISDSNIDLDNSKLDKIQYLMLMAGLEAYIIDKDVITDIESGVEIIIKLKPNNIKNIWPSIHSSMKAVYLFS